MRSCPVKAIGIDKGHARVIEERCILCGSCVLECPQQAKEIDWQMQAVIQAIKNGRQVIMSLAPSYVAAFPEYSRENLMDCLTGAGIATVLETAEAADIVSRIYGNYLRNSNLENQPVISSCCPAVVNMIERYYPNLIHNLAPVLSPMLTHARLIKEKFGQDSFVVFAGPCIAKIAEGKSPVSQIDAVITFEQLKEWLNRHNEATDRKVRQQERALSATSYAGRCFSIAGGIILPFSSEIADKDVIAVDGVENCLEVFEGVSKQEFSPSFIEAMACAGGCIGGPAMGRRQLMQTKRNKILNYAKYALQQECQRETSESISMPQIARSFDPKPVKALMPTEEKVMEILKQTGKFSPKDEKNCGACGYDTCRDKAIAVFQGLAETDMCVPYMRSKAESFANIIVENSLNAIIAVNEKMIIKEFNPAVNRMFGASKAIFKGMRLTELFDCTDFLAVAKFGHKIVGKRVEYPAYGIITEQMIIPVPEHGLVIAIITDVTTLEKKNIELRQMKLDTVEKATEVINKQMHVAQEIAGLLGETTAETKATLLELIGLIKAKEEV